MRVYIEEAIIVEVNETEPNFPIETVKPEIISDKKRKQDGLFDSLFDFIANPIGSLFGNDSLFGSLFDLLTESEEEPEELDPNPIQDEKPEIAIITETKERKVREYSFFYYEVVS